jgi:hypothetical protein
MKKLIIFLLLFLFSGNETAVVDIGHMPESCTDLKIIGYKMNGVFQIKGKNEKKQIENVYCNFAATNAEGKRLFYFIF